MSSLSIYDELDEAVEAMLRQPDLVPQEVNPELSDLLEVAVDLFTVPRADFRLRLKADLQHQAAVPYGVKVKTFPAIRGPRVVPVPKAAGFETDILPTLFGEGYGNYPIHRTNFLISALLHVAAMAAIVISSAWIMEHRQEFQHRIVSLVGEPGAYALPVAKQKAGGGGGGGDQDKLSASRGKVPRSAREQITPPAVVIRNDNPKFKAEATVVAPPTLTLPQDRMYGDPLAAILNPPSNGIGSGGGIGSGVGGGIGSGTGPGVGPGHGGGFGGGLYRVGGGVSAPRAIYDPDPEYSEEARKAKHQGTVLLWIVVGADGRPRDIRVQRALGLGLDEKAVEAVRKWRFAPAMRDGHPVAVEVNIEVNFRLY
jgi:periplasmic protein TonB